MDGGGGYRIDDAGIVDGLGVGDWIKKIQFNFQYLDHRNRDYEKVWSFGLDVGGFVDGNIGID